MKKRLSPRVGRILVEIGAVAAVLGGTACGDTGMEEGASDPELVDTVEQAFDPSPDPASGHGHVQITMKALKLLEARGMLPDALKGAANQALIVYGNNFADRTSAGFPNGGKPTQPMMNRMSARVPDDQTLVYKSVSGSFKLNAKLEGPPYKDPTITTTAKATVGWVPGKVGDSSGDYLSDSMRLEGSITVETDVILDGYLTGAKCIAYYVGGVGDCSSVQPAPTTRPLSFTVDNMYHYSYADLRDTGATFSEYDTRLRLFPFHKEHIPGHDGSPTGQDAAVKLSDSLRGQTLLAHADFGAQKYGSILYQLARRFFAKSPQPEPDLAQLIKVGNDVPGWRTGWMIGHGGFFGMEFEYPHSYLGGMPYVCAPPPSSAPPPFPKLPYSQSKDPCETGTPTWPPWIKTSPPQTEADLQALEQPRPGRSDRAALIYLGWAVHMMQDSAVPHHVAGWTGIEHAAQDAFGDKPYYYTDYTGVTVPKTTCIYPGGKLGPAFGCTTTRVPHQYASTYYSNQLVEKALATDLDNLLGPVGQKKSRNEICRGLGITSGDGSATDLNWRAIYPQYLETAKKAYDMRRTAPIPPERADAEGLNFVKNAVYGTIKLLLCSVPEEENVALNRPSWQSSTVWGYDAAASRANDGNSSGNFWDGSVSHTDAGFTWVLPEVSGQWWYTWLGTERVVKEVNIYNRTDCCSERLSHYKILAYDSSANMWKVISDQSASNTTNVPVIHHPISDVKTEYIMVAKTDDNYLQLAEVQVMGN